MTDLETQVADALATHYAVFSPLTDEEVARAVAAIQREIGDWGSDRLHAQWARLLATQIWGPNVAAAITAARNAAHRAHQGADVLAHVHGARWTDEDRAAQVKSEEAAALAALRGTPAT